MNRMLWLYITHMMVLDCAVTPTVQAQSTVRLSECADEQSCCRVGKEAACCRC